jgi:CheY-like chemotaxis protein
MRNDVRPMVIKKSWCAMNERTKFKVLLVEDCALVALDTKEIIEQAGYTVIGPAYSLEAAFTLLRLQKPDCALLDVNLDGTPVFSLAAELQSAGVPTAFLTGYSTQAVFPSEFQQHQCLQKPIQSEELIETLHTIECRAHARGH